MMGIFSLFRKAPDTKTLLANIQSEIETIDEYKYSVTRKQKNYIGVLLLISGLVYVVTALVCYFVYLPKSERWIEKILYSLPLVIFPFLVWALKRTLQWYYRWVIESKDERLSQLKKEKKKILEKVKETETFKDAKEILEKYDPKALFDLTKKNSPDMMTTPRHNMQQMTPQVGMSGVGSQMRYRGNAGVMSTPMTPMNRMPIRPSMAGNPNTPMSVSSGPTPTPRLALMSAPQFAPLPPQISRPILPQNRSIMEKLVDYVVSDGPNNRYALICNVCHSHNGMALKEEFEFIAYKCAYCARFNPPRKIRPAAPRLQSGRPSIGLSPLVDEPESDTDSTKGANDTKSESDQSKMNIVEVNQPGEETERVKQGDERAASGTEENVRQESQSKESESANQLEESSLTEDEKERRDSTLSDDSFDLLTQNDTQSGNNKKDDKKEDDPR